MSAARLRDLRAQKKRRLQAKIARDAKAERARKDKAARPEKRKAPPKKKRARPRPRTPADYTVIMDVRPRIALSRRRRLQHDEVVGFRCRVLELLPEAESLRLEEGVRGMQLLLPLPTVEKDGRVVRDLAVLAGKEVWLSLRVL